VWGFGVGAGFARAARLDETTRFDETTCFGDFAGFADLLKTSDSQPAWLTSIGRSTDAAIAEMMAQRVQPPKPAPANFLPDDSNPFPPGSDFLFALHYGP
jgi:hypothetical protein